MPRPAKSSNEKKVETLIHDEASRKNIPTAEFQSVMRPEDQRAIRVAYERRNRDLDPQLIWRGKYPGDDMDGELPLTVPAPPLYIREKVHPKVLIDDLKRETERRKRASGEGAGFDDLQADLFADFNGLPDMEAKTKFYQHDQHWSNRMILGDSLQVMASLAEREGLRGKVQCIYFDPPYGIKFNSNFQWSTTSRDVKDGNVDHITREPEQVKAFRDTWRDGIHSYLSYIRNRLVAARDLLAESGSIFVQIGDENVHRVRAVMDEVFGDENFIAEIFVEKTSAQTTEVIASTSDFLLFYARAKESLKYRESLRGKGNDESIQREYRRYRDSYGVLNSVDSDDSTAWTRLNAEVALYRQDNIVSQRPPGSFPVSFDGIIYRPLTGYWKSGETGLDRLGKAARIEARGRMLSYVRYFRDYPVARRSNFWGDTKFSSRSEDKNYVVQTSERVIERCLQMATDPGDLVLDPTCGSGTTAYVAEQWGRRWITIDTSRVALALARARIMGARYPYYLLSDSAEGQRKEAQLRNLAPANTATRGDIRQGFVYERVPHITLKSIANNAEIDVIWQEYEQRLLPLREELTGLLPSGWLMEFRKKQKYTAAMPDAIQEWEIPREWPAEKADSSASTTPASKERSPGTPALLRNDNQKGKGLHAQFWELRIARQKAIDASIAAKAEFENLYDKPYEDKGKVRVAGPFTVESLSPHRMLEMQDDELASSATASYDDPRDAGNFAQVMLDTLKVSGVQQADRNARITFDSLAAWPGKGMICAEGRYTDGDGKDRRAGIMIGPEFGTVSRPDLVQAAREAGDAGFDVVIACAFNFDAQSTEFSRLGRVHVLKARMNADLHMAEAFANTGKGNLFVIFGEPDIEIVPAAQDEILVRVKGVDVFNPSTGVVTSSEPDQIACWFVDTDYNEESFFLRQAYFLGASDPYKNLRTTLKAEINAEAWESLKSEISRPFPKPASGRIAVKVINHLGDEVMKVFTIH